MSRRYKKFQDLMKALKHRAQQIRSHHKSKEEVRDSMLPEEYLLMRSDKFLSRGEEWIPMARKLTRMAQDVMNLRKELKETKKSLEHLREKLKSTVKPIIVEQVSETVAVPPLSDG